MLNSYKKLNSLLTKKEQIQAKFVFLLMLVMAFMETLGVASVMPFVAVLSKPEFVETNKYLSLVYNKLGFTSIQHFLFFLGIILFILFVLSLATKALTTYVITRYSSMRLHSIACRLLDAYLKQPYDFYFGRNTADMGTTILSEVGQVTSGVLIPGLKVISDLLVTIALFILLMIVEPIISLTVAIILGGSYLIIYLCSHRFIRRIGEERLAANRQRYILANEGLNGIKELKILGREQAYLNRFGVASERYAKHQATHQIVGVIPRYGITAIAFGGVLLIVLYLLGRYGSIENALPVIALYTFAGYRLLPGFQEIYRNTIQLRFSLPVLDALNADLALKQQMAMYRNDIEYVPIKLEKSIQLDSVSYRYPDSDIDAINELSLEIPVGSSVAFVGNTGAGKSTVIDLILGLILPTSGRLMIDGQQLDSKNIRAWQDKIGYVPQTIYLADDTVAANIAFGVPRNEIDKKSLEYAARTAHIHDFIISELPKGYDSYIGERGIRLSGGQRQRLAIARALYNNPDIMVFDEATSALDNTTEAAVMEAIEELHGRKTLIIIAHRLSTIRNCDCIFLLNKGGLIATGIYSELIKSNKEFIQMVQANDKTVALKEIKKVTL